MLYFLLTMQKFQGTFLVEGAAPNSPSKYKVIRSVSDYTSGYRCIIVPNLNIDYYMLFGSIDFIVTETGGVLSHLAIVGREHGIPIFRAQDIISQVPDKGHLAIKDDTLEIG